MKGKKTILVFTIKCIAIPAAAVLILFLLNIPYRKIDDEKYMDMWNLRMLGNQINEVEIANVGSSHGAYDFTYDELTEEGFSCFNFGTASQTYQYDLALLEEYGEHLDEGCVLFIPVSYFSFNNETVNETEAQALSVKYYHCLSPKNIPDYDLYTDIVTTRLPILSAGEDLLKLLPTFSPSLKVIAAEESIDAEVPQAVDTASETANVNDSASETADKDDSASEEMDEAAIAVFAERAAARYDRHFNNKENLFLPEREDQLLSLIDYCKKHELKPVLITTPFSAYYNDPVSEDFLDRFYGTVNRIASDTNVNYYDYSHDARFSENLTYFSDSDHLNAEGAAYFMEIIADEVPELREIIRE